MNKLGYCLLNGLPQCQLILLGSTFGIADPQNNALSRDCSGLYYTTFFMPIQDLFQSYCHQTGRHSIDQSLNRIQRTGLRLHRQLRACQN